MLPHEQQRLQTLLGLLCELEQRQVPRHEQAILDVAKESVREAIREIAHRLHDGDYCRGTTSCRRSSVRVTAS